MTEREKIIAQERLERCKILPDFITHFMTVIRDDGYDMYFVDGSTLSIYDYDMNFIVKYHHPVKSMCLLMARCFCETHYDIHNLIEVWFTPIVNYMRRLNGEEVEDEDKLNGYYYKIPASEV